MNRLMILSFSFLLVLSCSIANGQTAESDYNENHEQASNIKNACVNYLDSLPVELLVSITRFNISGACTGHLTLMQSVLQGYVDSPYSGNSGSILKEYIEELEKHGLTLTLKAKGECAKLGLKEIKNSKFVSEREFEALFEFYEFYLRVVSTYENPPDSVLDYAESFQNLVKEMTQIEDKLDILLD